MLLTGREWKGGEGGAPAPCVFQRLRQVGQELDGELAQLVPPGLTSAQTDAVIPPGTLLPSGSLFAESRIPPSHLPPHLSTPGLLIEISILMLSPRIVISRHLICTRWGRDFFMG